MLPTGALLWIVSLTLPAGALAALRREGILRSDDRARVVDRMRIDPGYVVFDRARRKALSRILPELAALSVHPIGRYGAWTYSYMERAILDGLEVAERIRAPRR
jgi:hypothetical protein